MSKQYKPSPNCELCGGRGVLLHDGGWDGEIELECDCILIQRPATEAKIIDAIDTSYALAFEQIQQAIKDANE